MQKGLGKMPQFAGEGKLPVQWMGDGSVCPNWGRLLVLCHSVEHGVGVVMKSPHVGAGQQDY